MRFVESFRTLHQCKCDNEGCMSLHRCKSCLNKHLLQIHQCVFLDRLLYHDKGLPPYMLKYHLLKSSKTNVVFFASVSYILGSLTERVRSKGSLDYLDTQDDIDYGRLRYCNNNSIHLRCFFTAYFTKNLR